MEHEQGDRVTLEVTGVSAEVLAGPFSSQGQMVYTVRDDSGFVFAAAVSEQADSRVEALARALHQSDLEESVTRRDWGELDTSGYYSTARSILTALDDNGPIVYDSEGGAWVGRLDWVYNCRDVPVGRDLCYDQLADDFGPVTRNWSEDV